MKLLVLDGNSILNRAFYGIRLLSTKEGLYTNGIYGFMTMLEKLKHETEPGQGLEPIRAPGFCFAENFVSAPNRSIFTAPSKRPHSACTARLF